MKIGFLLLLTFTCLQSGMAQDLQKVKELTQQAEELIASGSYEDALTVLEQIRDIMGGLQGKPRELYNQAQDGIKARDAARRSRELDDAYNKLIKDGDDLLELGYYEKALEKYLEAADLKDTPEVQEKISELKRAHGSGMAAVYDDMAKSKEADKDYEWALDLYEVAQELNPQSWRSQKISDLQNRVEDFQQLIKSAEEKTNAYRYAEALTLYQKAGNLLPANEDGLKLLNGARIFYHMFRMDSLLNKNKPDEAGQEVRKMLKVAYGMNQDDFESLIADVSGYTLAYNGRRLYWQMSRQVLGKLSGQNRILDIEADLYDGLYSAMVPESLKKETFTDILMHEYTMEKVMDDFLDYIIESDPDPESVADGCRLFLGKLGFRPDTLLTGSIDKLRASFEKPGYRFNLDFTKANLADGKPDFETLENLLYEFKEAYYSSSKIPRADEAMMLEMAGVLNTMAERLRKQNLPDSALKYLNLNYRYVMYYVNYRMTEKYAEFSNDMIKDAQEQEELLKILPSFSAFWDRLFLPEVMEKKEVKEFFKLLKQISERMMTGQSRFVFEFYSPLAFGTDRSFDQMPYQYSYATSTGGTYTDPQGVDTRTIKFRNPVRYERIALRYSGNLNIGSRIQLPVGVEFQMNRMASDMGTAAYDHARPRAVGSTLSTFPPSTVVSVMQSYGVQSNGYRVFTLEVVPFVQVQRYVRLMAGVQRVSLLYHPASNCVSCDDPGTMKLTQVKPVTGIELQHPALLGKHSGLMVYAMNQSAAFHSDKNYVELLPEKDQRGTSVFSFRPMSYRAGAFFVYEKKEWGMKLGVESHRVRVNYLLPGYGPNAWLRGISRNTAVLSLRRKF